MLFLLALLYHSQHGVYAAHTAASIPALLSLADNLEARDTQIPSICLCPDQRSVWDILWSCLVTIFACSWVSIHPNMPAPGEGRWRTGLRRLELMVWTIIAPEMIIFWAMRQWHGARRLELEYKSWGWTRTHGYFAQMGGFMLFVGGKPERVLSPERMEELLRYGRITLPKITEEEIRDRSKGDDLSKALVLGQTLWFVAQCISRAIQRLVITKLELVTLAFAALNAVMYFLWWDKPLDIGCPVPVHLLEQPKIVWRWEKHVKTAAPTERLATKIILDAILSTILKACILGMKSIGFVVGLSSGIFQVFYSFMKTEGISKSLYTFFILFPSTLIVTVIRRLGDMAESQRSLEVKPGQMRISTFYASSITSSTFRTQAMLLTTTVAAIFGAIHCVGWSFVFPSRAELLIWRASSAIILGIPCIMVLASSFQLFVDRSRRISIARKNLFETMLTFLYLVIVAGLPIYIIARLLLLAEGFASLRDLPPGAYDVVEWTLFVPHFN